MAVLVEGISVIVRRDAVDRKFSGGWDGFVRIVPNATLCSDESLARVGFMTPRDVEWFVNVLTDHGLVFLRDGKAIDIAVADQQHGVTTPCEWLEFARLRFGLPGKVSACWFFDEPRIAHGIHMKGTSLTLATPPGWTFEDSLSHRFGFVPTGEEEERTRYLRKEGGLDVYLDLATGKEVFVSRIKRE